MAGLLSTPLPTSLLTSEQYVFRIHNSKDGQFYWTLHNSSGNTEAVATSETYKSKHSANHSISQIKRLAGGAIVEDLAK